MLELIPSGTKIPFMKYKWLMAAFSVVVTLGSFAVIIVKGFHFGVDFAGGVELVVRLPKSQENDTQRLRTALSKMGISDASVQQFGNQENKSFGEYIVYFASDLTDEEKVQSQVALALQPLAQPGEKLVTQFRFTGLEKAYLTLSRSVPFAELQKIITKLPFGLLQLENFEAYGRESSNEYQLTFQSVSGLVQTELLKTFSTSAEGVQPTIEKVDFVGAKVGKDLKLSALLSLLLTTVLIFVYIFVRFDLVYAPGVVLSLIHDVGLTAGVFALLGMEFDLTIVAALLTLAGYSINDTIIVYDRIREVARYYKGKSFEEIIDISANQTLSRTIITSGTVFLSALALYIWGGPVIHGFSFALLIGVVTGTYSSVFVAAPAILFTNWLKQRDSRLKKAA